MHKPIWYLKQIPEHFCDLAIRDFEQFEPFEAGMGENGNHHNHQQRNTTVRFIDTRHWFTYLLQGIGREANEVCKWGFDITGNEKIQYAEYKEDQHYDWHIDTFPLGFQTFDRKVSLVCLLSDVNEFTGGTLEIKHYSEYIAPLTKGSVIAFPSGLYHRVTKVETGLRKTATMWMNGPCFK